MKNTAIAVGIAGAMSLSFALGWYMNGFLIYKSIFIGQAMMMPEVGERNDTQGK